MNFRQGIKKYSSHAKGFVVCGYNCVDAHFYAAEECRNLCWQNCLSPNLLMTSVVWNVHRALRYFLMPRCSCNEWDSFPNARCRCAVVCSAPAKRWNARSLRCRGHFVPVFLRKTFLSFFWHDVLRLAFAVIAVKQPTDAGDVDVSPINYERKRSSSKFIGDKEDIAFLFS